jgi:hypothetical protein
MKFLFIDESEKQKGKNRRYFFCLCGLMVDEDRLFALNSDFDTLREKYKLSNLKDLRKKLPSKTKIKITKEICRILESKNTKIISAILGDVTLKDINRVDNAYFSALTFLIERFFIHLERSVKTGIIVFDSVDKNVEKSLRKKSFEFISKERHMMYDKIKGYYKEKIFPSIFFSNDEYTTVLQATDLIATSLNSAFWSSIQEGNLDVEDLPNKNKYLKIYWPLFVKNPAGKVNGWGIKVWW